MKLLTNKQFQGEILKATAPLYEQNRKYQDIIYNLMEEKESILQANEKHQEIIVLRENEIKRLEQELKTITEKNKKNMGAKGGLTKQINKLQRELDEANEKLSQRYIIRELKPEKPRNTQTMKTKDSSVTSKIIKKVVENV